MRFACVTSFPQTQQSFWRSPGRAPVSDNGSAVAVATADEPEWLHVQARLPAIAGPTVPPQRGQSITVDMNPLLSRGPTFEDVIARFAQPGRTGRAYPDQISSGPQDPTSVQRANSREQVTMWIA
jgi:hypothetical protein